MSLSKQVILVTGGGTGIGAGAAIYLASLGAHVLISGRRLEPLERLAAAHPRLSLIPVQGDAGNEKDLARIRDLAVSRFGALHHAFLNAGVGATGGGLDNETAEELSSLFATNIVGPILGLKVLSSEIGRHRGAIIINSSSLSYASAHALPSDLFAAYAVSKVAADGVVRAYHPSLSARGVRLFGVNPGVYRSELASTELQREAIRKMGMASLEQVAFLFNPNGVLGEAEDFGPFIESLLLGTSRHLTGHHIAVFPSATPGKPLTLDAQFLYAHISDPTPVSAILEEADWRDVTGAAFPAQQLAEIKQQITQHKAKVEQAMAAAHKK